MSCTRPDGTIINSVTDVGANFTTAPYSYPAAWAANYSPPTNFQECLLNGVPFARTNGSVNSSDVTNHVRNTLLKKVYPVNVAADVTVGYTGINSITAEPPSLSNAASNFAKDNINPAAAFAQSSNKLRSNLEDEYCFYHNRYRKFLFFILSIASNPAGVITDAKYLESIDKTNLINNKLNDIILILKELAKQRDTTLSGYYGADGVNQVNTDLEAARLQLEDDIAKLNKSELQKDIQSAMMEYTIEKNQSSRNLLAIYGFMNIVAIGMLYYLYRNGK
jgi:hypothetical protein